MSRESSTFEGLLKMNGLGAYVLAALGKEPCYIPSIHMLAYYFDDKKEVLTFADSDDCFKKR
eukprot:10339123-Karenia_brevis.AAC.1